MLLGGQAAIKSLNASRQKALKRANHETHASLDDVSEHGSHGSKSWQNQKTKPAVPRHFARDAGPAFRLSRRPDGGWWRNRAPYFSPGRGRGKSLSFLGTVRFHDWTKGDSGCGAKSVTFRRRRLELIKARFQASLLELQKNTSHNPAQRAEET